MISWSSTGTDLPGRTDAPLRSTLINRNIVVGGHRTSMRLEPVMWQALREICAREGKTMSELATEIDRRRCESSLTSAMRAFALAYFRAAATEEGHRRAGHGAQVPV